MSLDSAYQWWSGPWADAARDAGVVVSSAWLFLATPVQFWAGWPFYQGLWSTLQHRTADMNTLIALGTSAAYLYSVVATFLPGLFAIGHGVHVHVYYETSVVIIT